MILGVPVHLDQLAGRGCQLELVDLPSLPSRPAEAPGGHQIGGLELAVERALEQLLDLSPPT